MAFKDEPTMDKFEKSVIVGHYRNGVPFATIASIFGISTSYVEQIIKEYLQDKKESPK